MTYTNDTNQHESPEDFFAEEQETANDGASTETSQEEQEEASPIEHSRVLQTLLAELKPINFYEKAGLSDGERITQRHFVILVVQEVLVTAKHNHWSLCITDGTLYIFNGAYWKALSKQEVQQFLGTAAEILAVPIFDARYHAFRGDLMKQFVSHAYLPKPNRNGGEVLINLLNGTFFISPEQQYLRPFDRSDFLTYQLSFSHDPEAEAPLFNAYLNRVLPDESQQKILAEYIGYIFIKQHTLKLEKSLILYGSGANGKSLFFEVVTAMLGAENVSHYSLQSLTNETGYQRAKLKDKLLNYASEISPRMDSTIYKQMVSGEPVEARLPYGEPFMLTDYAKLLFNTNTLPKDVEQNVAFFRRFIILHFKVTIPEEERNPALASMIINSELPGVFNWVLYGLHRLLKQRKFTYSRAAEETLQEYRQQSDSVQLFLKDEIYEKSTIGETALKIMYDGYRSYCTESGYKSCSLKIFGERLRNQGYVLHRKKKGFVVDAVKNSL